VVLSIKGVNTKKVSVESPDRTKRRVVTQDTRLDLVANEVYGDSAEWRGIAAANGIRNPRKLMPGAALIIPPLVTSL
jgi:nucleoid-associated protein YgaU